MLATILFLKYLAANNDCFIDSTQGECVMDNRKDLTNLDRMIDYFSIKKEYELVGTLQRARYTLFPDVLQKELEGFDSKEAEEEIDRIIETLQREVDYFEEQDRRKFRLPSSTVKTVAISGTFLRI